MKRTQTGIPKPANDGISTTESATEDRGIPTPTTRAVPQVEDMEAANDTNAGGIRDARMLTKYERIKVVGVRAEQLSRGAEPFVPVPDKDPNFDPCIIAERELDQGVLPFIVVRRDTTTDSKILIKLATSSTTGQHSKRA